MTFHQLHLQLLNALISSVFDLWCMIFPIGLSQGGVWIHFIKILNFVLSSIWKPHPLTIKKPKKATSLHLITIEVIFYSLFSFRSHLSLALTNSNQSGLYQCNPSNTVPAVVEVQIVQGDFHSMYVMCK